MHLIFGLGNPGLRYKRTRHNLGFLVLDELAERLNFKINRRGYQALRKEVKIGSKRVVLVKPQTYMNNSGEAVKALVKKYRVKLKDIFVVSDDIDLNFGEIRIRRKGRDAGHRGIRSIIQSLGDTAFSRMKIGIGPLRLKEDPSVYVLRKIKRDEWKKYKEVTSFAALALEDVIVKGIEAAMQRYNGKVIEF